MPMFQFIGAGIGAGLVIITASLAWPRISPQPRPEALQKVRDVVVETEAGRNFAEVLGVSDESQVKPMSIPELAAGAVQSVATTIATNAQRAVAGRVWESLAKQFENLPEEEKAMFRAQICVPPPSP